jgi:hypothetical protein
MTVSKYLTRREVPSYLREKHGEPAVVTEKTLAKYAVLGGGPAFTKFGRKVGYTPDNLDAWVAARARNCRSTSEAI